MGKNLIIKGADFSQNAVSLPEIVQLTEISSAFATSASVIEGTTRFEDINFTSNAGWYRWTAPLDLNTYKYTSLQFNQTSGSANLLNIWILDGDGVVIKKMSSVNMGSYNTINELEITKEDYPTAVSIGFCTNYVSDVFPRLIREEI